MDLKKLEQSNLLLEHVPGAVAIDMNGIVTYMNEQCAEYMSVSRDESVGRHIHEVFPESKMLENININKPKIVFYFSFGAGISMHVPLFKNGSRIGLMEYDFVQASESLYDLANDYIMFLDEHIGEPGAKKYEITSAKYSINSIIGKSEAVEKLKRDIVNAAKSESTVLISGETGTGKELVAHSIHNLSRRSRYNFVRVNTAGIPENLAESELFGYEEGSFTGAKKKGKAGKFELADRGTLFLDEIHQMSKDVQPKLLRVLQEHEVEKIGSDKNIPVDVRVIASTNLNLAELVRNGEFREDLFYRLYVVPVNVPPLRERLEDIELLTDHLIGMFSRKVGRPIRVSGDEVYSKLRHYRWPGNVRELQNVIERAVTFSDGGVITEDDIVFPMQTDDYKILDSESPIEEVKKKAERQLIVEALAKCGQNKTEAAKLLKISRPQIYQKMKRLGL